MFSIEFLHTIRAAEVAWIAGALSSGARVLELGGGTGWQAKDLRARGFDVVAIDLPASTYSDHRVHEVIEYDGCNFPFPASSFDVVFSSSCLEHVRDLDAIHRESRRVLRHGGTCLHIMPTGAWRFWTYVAGYPDMVVRWIKALPQLIPRGLSRTELRRLWGVAVQYWSVTRDAFVPPPHGELGSAFAELRTFSRRAWIRRFENAGFEVVRAEPMRLFYTGHMTLGSWLPLGIRTALSHVLGSACVAYTVRPMRDS